MWGDHDSATQRAPDAARKTLKTLATSNGKSLQLLARLIDRSPSYLEQYLNCGWPRFLPDDECRILARHFGIEEQTLARPARR